MKNQIIIEILDDGTLSIKTSEISVSAHMSADQLLEDIETLMGGKVIKKENPEKKQHTHNKAFAK